jgi:NhaP-type Na+/H+ or K+/H+ antiporter
MRRAMQFPPVITIAGLIVFGVGAQWLAWRVRIPSILLFLGLGFAVGPLAQAISGETLLDPDALMGDLLLPFVGISVALVLFEGGMSLHLRELREAGGVVWRLVTIGALVTWVCAAGAAWAILGFSMPLAILLGAILVVTGPTVIMPLLREIRPKGAVGAAVKWEGIVIDPIGAMLALLVFELIGLGDLTNAAGPIAIIVAKTILAGGAIGAGAGLVLALMLRRFWIPDYLHGAVALMFVIASYTASNMIQHESGLFAVTVMGILLANQRLADIRHITEFKENLQVVLIPVLFILLAARVRIDTLLDVGWMIVPFVAALILVARPLSVYVSTIGSRLSRGERLFLMLMAPRGIVAASVAAVFALRLMERMPEARAIVPVTFMVILGTVLIYGLGARAAAKRLGVSDIDPQGALIVGAGRVSLALAEAVRKAGFRAVLVDTNRQNVAAARMAGFDTHLGSILADRVLNQIDFAGVGKVLATTPNNLVNVLAANRLREFVGRRESYQLTPDEAEMERLPPRTAQGRRLFGATHTHADLESRLLRGAVVKATPITPEFTFTHFRERHGDAAAPLFIVTESKRLTPITVQGSVEPKPGHILISFVEVDETGAAIERPASPAPDADGAPTDPAPRD